jgi:hypothetical protein
VVAAALQLTAGVCTLGPPCLLRHCVSYFHDDLSSAIVHGYAWLRIDPVARAAVEAKPTQHGAQQTALPHPSHMDGYAPAGQGTSRATPCRVQYGSAHGRLCGRSGRPCRGSGRWRSWRSWWWWWWRIQTVRCVCAAAGAWCVWLYASAQHGMPMAANRAESSVIMV